IDQRLRPDFPSNPTRNLPKGMAWVGKTHLIALGEQRSLLWATMPRDGAIIVGDLIGKLDVLAVACDKCGRIGRYHLGRLIDTHGHDFALSDWLADVAGDCPKRVTVNWNDRCRAQCPRLPEVL
ncbi:MAG TPA: hypothetical protein VIV34_04685, partial [Pseudolabrys sp.]